MLRWFHSCELDPYFSFYSCSDAMALCKHPSSGTSEAGKEEHGLWHQLCLQEVFEDQRASSADSSEKFHAEHLLEPLQKVTRVERLPWLAQGRKDEHGSRLHQNLATCVWYGVGYRRVVISKVGRQPAEKWNQFGYWWWNSRTALGWVSRYFQCDTLLCKRLRG